MLESWLTVTLFALAIFRLTRLIVFDKITDWLRRPFHEEYVVKDESGAEEIYIKMKGKGIRKWIGELLSCYWCTGVWCTAFLYTSWRVWPAGAEPLICVLALAGFAGIIETAVSRLLD
ncbi:DUF1360 domain-containing protein [Metabacillus sp. FJAT-52054]|uniref:DUF1360 domain-containing protein n=1 Tax=Metabacillus sediminis TaxID=3117746 RepID=A0ABZ2NK37_9BACI